jgi:hypothetical protein
MAKKIKVRKSGSHKSHKNHSEKSSEKSMNSINSQNNIWMIIAIISIVLNVILGYYAIVPNNNSNSEELNLEEQLEQSISQLSGLIQNSESDEKSILNTKIEELKNILNNNNVSNTNNTSDNTQTNNETQVPIKLITLNDNRCAECEIAPLITQLEQMLGELDITEYDYSSVVGKNLYESLELELLPVLLFEKSVENSASYAQIQPYMETYGDYLSLRFGAFFDPTKEICDNEIDDTGNGLVDCEDSDCSGEFVCMEKLDKPIVELFVMSHCPYGTQTEKGFIPAIELLGDKIDFELKFVDYAMHGKTELDEQTLQYCIQKEQNDKFIPYLKCFLEEGDTNDCLDRTNIDNDSLKICIDKVDKEYKITELYNDQSTWSGGRFPQFNIHKEENEKYGIQGSPGLALNGVKAESFGRDPASALKVICTGFKEKPEECNQTLDSASPSAGFGYETTDATNSNAQCG